MRLRKSQLRALISEEMATMSQARRRGGARAALGFGIPEESPGYGASAEPEIGSYEATECIESMDKAIEELGQAHGVLAYGEHALESEVRETLQKLQALRKQVHDQLLGPEDEAEMPRGRGRR